MNKLGMSPVVAIALLMVVAVVSVVGFQNWFNTFSTQTLYGVESQGSGTVIATSPRTVIGNQLYFNNGYNDNLTISKVTIGGNDCQFSGSINNGLSNISLSNNCTQNLSSSVSEIVVYTDKGIFSSKLKVGTIGSSSSSEESISMANFDAVFNFSYDAGGTDTAYSLEQDSSNNFVIAGYISRFMTWKFDPTGTHDWTQTYSSGSIVDYAEDVSVGSDDSIYTFGISYVSAAVDYDYRIVKYNSAGTQQWAKTASPSSGSYVSDAGMSIAINLSTDNIYFTGYAGATSGGGWANHFIYTVCYNSAGNELWTKSFDGPYLQDWAYDIELDSEGNLVICGGTRKSSEKDLQVISYNYSGTLLWNKTYNISTDEMCYGLAIDSSDNIILTGLIDNGVDNDMFVMKLNSSGTPIWNTTFDNSNDDKGNDVGIDSSDNIFIVGESNVSTTKDYLLVKYNSDGTYLGNVTYDSGGEDIGYDIVIDSSDNVTIGGSASSDIFVIRYTS